MNFTKLSLYIIKKTQRGIYSMYLLIIELIN
jgi:hypothetical protein